jgi:UTRA domain
MRSGDRQLDERTGNEVRQTVRAVAAALMRALPATTQVADALGLESSDQVIARSRVTYDAADVPIEYSTNYVRGESAEAGFAFLGSSRRKVRFWKRPDRYFLQK